MSRFFVKKRRGKTESWRVLLDEAVAEGVLDELGIALEAHLFKEAGPMGADRLHTDAEVLGDPCEAFAGADHGHDLQLPVREGLVSGLEDVGPELGEQFLREGWAQGFAAPRPPLGRRGEPV